MKKIITSILENKEYEARFYARKKRYRKIKNYIPRTYEEIINDKEPWFCHGLAFRLATFSSSDDNIFEKLDSLLELAENLDGWQYESMNTGLTWPIQYNEFFHHIWMLQCVEYFLDKGYSVIFPGKQGVKSPDLKVMDGNNIECYCECYVYSKWWFIETFFEHIIELIDPNLSLERTYNIRQSDFKEKLINFERMLEPSILEDARIKAAQTSPYIIDDNNGLKLIMEGDGKPQANPDNAHGDPGISAKVYLDEIVRKKEDENDLATHRPNRLMVNCLGIDFQKIFSSNRVKKLSFASSNIDKLVLNSCGINENLAECSRTLSLDAE